MNWTQADYERLKAKGLISESNLRQKLKSKYGNTKTQLDNITFDSKKEAERYQVLKHWQEVGAISNLQLQVKYELNMGGTHSVIYICDFVYLNNISMEIVHEDTKGFLTAVYRKKKRLMKKIYGIDIKET